jgi:hypothetical protein
MQQFTNILMQLSAEPRIWGFSITMALGSMPESLPSTNPSMCPIQATNLQTTESHEEKNFVQQVSVGFRGVNANVPAR